MIQEKIALVKFRCYTAIAISPFIFVIDGSDLLFCRFLFVSAIHAFQVIVKGRTGQLSDWKKNLQRMFLPQLLNYLRLLCRRRSSSKTKACKFFRYSFSARSRWTSASRSSSTALGNFLLCIFIFVFTIHPLQMIVEGRTGQLSDWEKYHQFVFMPQLLNYLRFLCWRRSSSKTKACKFFR